jgi:hypothetical protein
MINNGRVSFLRAPELDGMLEGGVPIVVDGHTVGAVGVSGVKSAEDAQIAKAGIAALGLPNFRVERQVYRMPFLTGSGDFLGESRYNSEVYPSLTCR